ncbi:hypothetical protein AX774_g4977 [Zancudomyces culisetae]|uniref:Uncharacterized protein n=1 Tax=Zancudomyces culisetae TaxID=1213189 RepID=A0A1R1PKV2_ZANCU|nr:hypothetical protein AX774_g4977 [Zancudomyces culisetae]|eukprot:OMH81586.1 hypothetical protein AX774_g4977 [Zancudomyces culisetae]
MFCVKFINGLFSKKVEPEGSYELYNHDDDNQGVGPTSTIETPTTLRLKETGQRRPLSITSEYGFDSIIQDGQAVYNHLYSVRAMADNIDMVQELKEIGVSHLYPPLPFKKGDKINIVSKVNSRVFVGYIDTNTCSEKSALEDMAMETNDVLKFKQLGFVPRSLVKKLSTKQRKRGYERPTNYSEATLTSFNVGLAS